jgi:two-component system, OmpR family, sensor kinase
MTRTAFSLRLKLTVLNVAVFSGIIAVLSIVMLAVREEFVRADFDDRLIDRATNMMEAIELVGQHPAGPLTRPDGSGRLIPFRFPGFFFQLRLTDGTVVERSENLQEMTLPWDVDSEESSRTGLAVLETVHGSVADALTGAGTALRMATLCQKPEVGDPFCLQVAVSIGPLDRSIAQLRRLFLFVVPIGVLAAGVASWFLADRALAPIGRIAREARSLTAAHLDRRLDLPPGRDELTELVVTVNGMLDRLEAAFQAQERFVANAAHELKTPAAVVLGQTQVLAQQQRTPEEYARFLASVQEEMQRIGQLVNSLLTLARADAGFRLAATVAVSVNDVVTDAVQRCQSQAEQRRVRLLPLLAMPASDDPEPMVMGDADLLNSMLMNLIHNGVRHSPSGETVEVEVGLDGAAAVVAVRDRGPGIPPQFLGRVFDRFFRVPGGDREQGTGLGLAIAKGVAQMHGGSIEVANQPDAGCEFIVRLPIAGPAANWH